MSNQNKRPDTVVTTGKARLSYVNVFKAKAIADGQTPKYSISVIIPKSDTKTIAAINAAVEKAKVEGMSKLLGKDKVLPKNIKMPLRDGDDERPNDPAYKDAYFLNANTTNKPPVVDLERTAIDDPLEVYSGCYGRVGVNFYAFNTNGNRGIACGLRSVQKVADGEALGNVVNVDDDFGDDFQNDDDI